MTCRELVELVSDYFEGALTEEVREAFAAHIAVCPGCDDYVEQLRTTIRLVHDTEALEQRPEVTALLAAFSRWQRSR